MHLGCRVQSVAKQGTSTASDPWWWIPETCTSVFCILLFGGVLIYPTFSPKEIYTCSYKTYILHCLNHCILWFGSYDFQGYL